MKTALVCGGGGFIGSHLVKRLKRDGLWVRAVDLKFPEFSETAADDFVIGDLRDAYFCRQVIDRRFDEVYQLAADMGGAGFIFTGENDADIMFNSASINLNVLETCRRRNIRRIFYSSSACMYPAYNQEDPDNPNCAEDSAYPAAPDSEYGWEKLFSERLYLTYGRCHGIEPRIARYHNIFGPEGTWGAGGAVPQGRRRARRRVDRDLGRRPPDPLVSLCVGMRRGHGAPHPVRFLRSGQYRLRGDGDDRPARRPDHRHCRQAPGKAARPGPARGPRPQLRQSLDSGEARLGAVAAVARRALRDLRLGRAPGQVEHAVAAKAPGRVKRTSPKRRHLSPGDHRLAQHQHVHFCAQEAVERFLGATDHGLVLVERGVEHHRHPGEIAER